LVQRRAQDQVIFDELSFTGVTDGDQYKTAGGNVEAAPPDQTSHNTRFIEEWGIGTTWLKAAVLRRTRITLRDMRCARRCHARSVGTRCRIMYPYHK